MKSKFFTLLKAGMANTLASSKIAGTSGSKKKKTALIILFAFLGLYLCAISVIFTVWLYDSLAPVGLKLLIPCLFITASSVLNLLSALFASSGFLFKAKDLPLLFSLPVSHRGVLIVKFTLFYLSEILISFITLGVSVITFFILDGITLMTLLTGLIGLFIAPLLPMCIGMGIAFGVGMLIRNFKHKNQIVTVATVISAVGISLLFYANTSMTDTIIANAKAILEKVASVYFPAKLFIGAFDGEIVSLLLFVALNVLPLILAFLIISVNYSSLVASYNSVYTGSDYKYTGGAKRKESAFGTLLYKEIKRVVSSANYLLNACSGMLMLLMMIIVSFRMNGSSEQAEGMLAMGEDIRYLVISGAVALACGLSSTTTSTISLEAKTLWILRSAPIDMQTLFRAKALTNFVLQLPIAVISITINSIVLGFSFVQAILLYLLAASVLATASYAGLVINLLLPKLDWQNETQAIKQSSSVLLYMLGGLVLSTIVIGLAVLGKVFLRLDTVTLIAGMISVYCFVFLAFRSLAMNWGVRRFKNIY